MVSLCPVCAVHEGTSFTLVANKQQMIPLVRQPDYMVILSCRLCLPATLTGRGVLAH
jgi:hypothetical protein